VGVGEFSDIFRFLDIHCVTPFAEQRRQTCRKRPNHRTIELPERERRV